MDQQQPSIRHVSDTARWAAVFRARESERQDAAFRDPFARVLAGERGEEIFASLPFHEAHSWSWVARTWAFDKLIREQIAGGADLVINLAAGLDARPYRMELPPELRWVEVDLPEIFDYKESVLANEKPRCVLERIRFDLGERDGRRALLESICVSSNKAVVLSEGLLIYLSPRQVGELADDLRAITAIHAWIVDIASPGLLEMIRKYTGPQMGAEVTPIQFAPANGPDFFLDHGWQAVEVLSTMKVASKIKRLPTWQFKFFAFLPEPSPARMRNRPWSGICRLVRK